MFGKISIIGCGLIGSSILRAMEEKILAIDKPGISTTV